MRSSLARFTYLAPGMQPWPAGDPACAPSGGVPGALTSGMECRKAWRRGHDSQGFHSAGFRMTQSLWVSRSSDSAPIRRNAHKQRSWQSDSA